MLYATKLLFVFFFLGSLGELEQKKTFRYS